MKIPNPIKFFDRCKYSAKKRIEKTPHVGKFEQSWYRSGSRELRVVGMDRSEFGVYIPNPSPGDRAHIHTHVGNAAVLSHTDWLGFQSFVKYHDMCAMHIVSILDNKVAGYVTFRATKKFIDTVKDKNMEVALVPSVQAYDELGGGFGVSKDPVKYGYDFMKTMQKNGWFRMKATPMKGYVFREGRFIEKKGLGTVIRSLLNKKHL